MVVIIFVASKNDCTRCGQYRGPLWSAGACTYNLLKGRPFVHPILGPVASGKSLIG